MSEWIDVKQRMPEVGIEVIVYCASDATCTEMRVTTGNYDGNGFWDQSDDDEYSLGLVTHWMPLPVPPEAKLEAQ